MAASRSLTATKKRRWPWLVVAMVLFAAGAWLMAGTEEVETRNAQKVSLPRKMTSAEHLRNDERQTMPLTPPVFNAEGVPAPRPPRDPVLAGMPTEIKHFAFVIEANAIRNSELGDLLIECLFTGEGDGLAAVNDAGFDPIDKLDRVAVVDGAVMLAGDFSQADFRRVRHTEDVQQFGPNTDVYTRRHLDGGVGDQMAVWKKQMIVLGNSFEKITAVIDRLDGKGDPAAKRVLTDADAYGELYGVVMVESLAKEMAGDNPAFANLLRDAASSIKVHADVSHDVGLVADIEGTDPAKTQELRKALGAMLTIARLQAEAKGNKDAAEVLGFGRVAQAKNGSANFNLEAGLPFEFLEAQLRKCVDGKKKKLAEKAEGR